MIKFGALKTNCFCLLNSDKVWDIDKTLINKIIKHLREKKIAFSYFSVINDKYKDRIGSIENMTELNEENIHIIDLFSSEDSMITDYLLSISQGSEKTNNCIFFESKENSNLRFKDLILLLEGYFNIDYGFSYVGAKGKYSQSYVLGFKGKSKYLKDISRKNQKLYDKWFDVNMNIKDGIMRDVYKENVLNENHINNKCSNGMSLGELIRTDTIYGSIEQLANNLYYWKIEPENLEKVREILYKEDFVI